MDAIWIAIIVVGMVVVIAGVAWLLYKANFRAKEITIKAGPVEAKMERDIGAPKKEEATKPRTEAAIEALDGGDVLDSTIAAPAQSGAKAKIKASGEGSEINNSHIELK